MEIIIAIIGICAAAMLLWYVYILMKGDDQDVYKRQRERY